MGFINKIKITVVLTLFFSYNLGALANSSTVPFYSAVLTEDSLEKYLDTMKESLSNENSVLITGDSASSGAVSDPEIKPQLLYLLWELSKGIGRASQQGFSKAYLDNDLLKRDHHPKISVIQKAFGERKLPFWDLIPPTRLWWTDSILEQNGAKILDYEQYSWGYIWARSRGILPWNVVFTSRDGQQIDDFPFQIKRYLSFSGQKLPHWIFIQFTGNDLCSIDVYNEPDVSIENRISRPLREGLELIKSAQPHKLGTHIVLLPFMDLVQMVDSQNILQSPALLDDPRFITCSDMRNDSSRKIDILDLLFIKKRIVINKLQEMCGSILKADLKDTMRHQLLREKIQVVRSAHQTTLSQFESELSIDQKKTLSLHYLSKLEEYKHNKGDVANDCFHFGVKANVRISDILEAELSHLK